MNTLFKIAVSMVCAAVASGAAAHAGMLNQPRTQTISFADLDLAKPAGVEVLKGRIKAAASAVCGGTPDVRELSHWQEYQSCAQRATEGAMAKMSNNLERARQSRLAVAH